LVIEYWNLRFIWDLALGNFDFRHKAPKQRRSTWTWSKEPGISEQNKTNILFFMAFLLNVTQDVLE
jgi:hypothetical protein